MRKTTGSPLEKEIESKSAKFAKDNGVLTYKFVSPSQRGVPDRLFILPGGQTIFVEFKRPGGKATPLQLAHIRRLNDQGAPAYVCDTVEAFKQILEKHL